MKRAAAFALVALLGGCDQARVQELEKRASALEQQVEQATAKLKEAETRLADLEAENTRLRETDQVRFQKAVDLEAAGKIADAAREFSEVATKFPTGPFAAQARSQADALNEKLESLKAAAKKAVAELAKRVAAAPDATSAAKILDDLTNQYPFQEVSEAVGKYREELQASLAKEKEAATNAADLGIEISNLRTYWTINPNVRGGKEIVVPYIRFNVKNVSERPITSLRAKAAFELVENKEMLGDGGDYVIGSMDPPLKPGYTKEVFFGSSTGFTAGYGIITRRPRTTADLYIQTSEGQERLVKTIRISSELQY